MSQAKQTKNKPFRITMEEVELAYARVKANDGAAGVDEQTFADVEKDLEGNLYKIWNRMSSGSYFPPPVLKVTIPKADGGERRLGIPTVLDRVAQMVVKNRLEPLVEPYFMDESYGYRPGKSALEAVGQARHHCWHYNWVLDLDIKGFFDNIDHGFMMRLVCKHTQEPLILLYVQRWLEAPAQDRGGFVTERVQGTPQGGVISPLLANLFLHYAFDRWLRMEYPHLPFERYADDAIVHCRSEAEAQALWVALEARLRRCGLELHPEKTKIVYCKDDKRSGRYEHEEFTFLGYTFRPRSVRAPGGRVFVGFNPAVSDEACQTMRAEIRNWKLHRRSDLSLEELAQRYNPVLRGWKAYFGCFHGSALAPVFRQLDYSLVRWAMRKYKRLHRQVRRATGWLNRIIRSHHPVFAHWKRAVPHCSSVGAV